MSAHAHNINLRCSISEVVVSQAVRDSKQNLYDLKVAQLHNIDVKQDEVTTQTVQSKIKATMPLFNFEGNKQKWKRIFPSPTDNFLQDINSK